MSKKKTTTTTTMDRKTVRVTRQSAVSAHDTEFAEKVMGPKFWALLVDHDFDLTYSTLTTVYNTTHGTRLSATSIKKYLDLLGWKYERKPLWTGLPTPEAVDTDDLGSTTNAVDTAAILHAPDEEEKPKGPFGVMGELPGQGAMTPDEQALLG